MDWGWIGSLAFVTKSATILGLRCSGGFSCSLITATASKLTLTCVNWVTVCASAPVSVLLEAEPHSYILQHYQSTGYFYPRMTIQETMVYVGFLSEQKMEIPFSLFSKVISPLTNIYFWFRLHTVYLYYINGNPKNTRAYGSFSLQNISVVWSLANYHH